ncbi:hypothetical protein [Caballeronia sp. LZ034LL]|uniref:hypothetical protein n=1 Tax=Caballeronia sp. LZ034LL TaxID=3038567 RepID=UPI00286743BB|nr:hypothetical protein [Caballeronia sp. LZ034LL]MDR5836526.1 hypothetical protein [Caballeronia sp. LZ034LL]
MSATSKSASFNVTVRKDGSGAWSIAMPHAERPDDVFVTFVKDQEEGTWLAEQMRPGFDIVLEAAT